MVTFARKEPWESTPKAKINSESWTFPGINFSLPFFIRQRAWFLWVKYFDSVRSHYWHFWRYTISSGALHILKSRSEHWKICRAPHWRRSAEIWILCLMSAYQNYIVKFRFLRCILILARTLLMPVKWPQSLHIRASLSRFCNLVIKIGQLYNITVKL